MNRENMPVSLKVKNVSFDYSNQPLLEHLQFMVDTGCLLHVRGDNGSGKTTLLKLLSGMLFPHEGDICFNQQSIYKNMRAYQQNICYVGHKTGVNQLLTVRENCRFELQHHASSFLDCNKWMKDWGLENEQDTPCNRLSAGQRRRVGLMRLSMSRAPIWILDEPLIALDQQTIVFLMKTMQHHLAGGGLIILTSHQDLPQRFEYHQEYFL